MKMLIYLANFDYDHQAYLATGSLINLFNKLLGISSGDGETLCRSIISPILNREFKKKIKSAQKSVQ